jgi:tRNA nucleotidyltransferase (CCA-adding enzyme)
MQVYLVGGAVRDELLGLKIADRDWVVTGARPADMLAQGYLQVGKDFPVFLHPRTREEYALARTERKSGRGHKGFQVNADPSVTLEEDLLRRDLTINAIARDSQGVLIDPFGGVADIEARLLRHVSPAFCEDPLRVLRVARFAARFASRGFSVAPDTLHLMREMTDAGELEHLPAERIWGEMQTALREESPAVFFSVLQDCGALHRLLPEAATLLQNKEPSVLDSLQCATDLTTDPIVRFVALIHHGGPSGIQRIADRLRLPRDYFNIARLVSSHFRQFQELPEATAEEVLTLLEALDGFRRPLQVEQFLLACLAETCATEDTAMHALAQAELLRAAFAAARQVKVGELLKGQGLKTGSSDEGRKDALLIRAQVRKFRAAAIQTSLASRGADRTS